MSLLKYPIDLNERKTDYVVFTHFGWKNNRKIAGGLTADGNIRGQYDTGFMSDPQSEGNTIVLYVPQSMPAMSQSNNYKAETAPGELGNIKRQIGAMAAGVGYGNDPGQAARSAADSLLSALNPANSVGGPLSALRQRAMEDVASRLGQDAGSLIALGSGKILNPNVEVIYQGPTLRQFSMDFTFAPKDSAEARAIKDIIYEFKFWSAPSGPRGGIGGMLEVPHVWRVKYKGLFEKNVNPFKRAVLSNVNVDYNSGLNSHMTFDDGEPILIALTLTFREVDYVTRDDHDKARGAGYMGGF